MKKRSKNQPAACSHFLREQVRLLKDAGWITHAKEFERAITALQVIHTWAIFDGGRCLDPEHVANLTRKALKGLIRSNPNASDQTPRTQDHE